MNRIVASPLDPAITSQGRTADDMWTLFVWLGLAVFGFVTILIVYTVIRYRRRDDRLPRQKHYNIPLEVTYTAVPFVVVLGLFAITVVSIGDVDQTNDDPDLQVDVTAFQWQWEFEYPESGVRVIGGEQDDIPTLVLPADSSVSFRLESLDVIHSFWVTAFRFKRDMIPGTITEFAVDIDADAAGSYPNAGVCAEYCGLDHAFMQFSVEVLEPAEFEQWIADQPIAQENT